MKRIIIAALIFIAGSILQAQAQGWGNDAVAKRTNLVFRLRSLGPLAPDSWLNAGANYAINAESALQDGAFHPMGAFAYTGMSGNDRIFTYWSSGQWFLMDPNKVTTGLRWDHFGLHNYQVAPQPQQNYYALAEESYSVAGLRYQEVRLFFHPDYSHWVTPGSGFHTFDPFRPENLMDLIQRVEIPSFAVADFWFGPFFTNAFNFPVDYKLPTPQSTFSQKNGAFLLAPLNQYTTNIAWVQEGVYRPGLTLQPGYSSPRLYTYMQTYFDRAWRPDPVTGDVPRLSTTNWNGIGRINTNSATPAGFMPDWASYFGYYFYATNYGKVILTTKPQENGHYGELPAYTLGLLVDKNRDGALDLKDTTSATNAHVFWVNNDADRPIYETHNLWDELDFQAGVSTNSDTEFVRTYFRIPSVRDLEDYDRLQVRGLGELCRDLPTGQGYTVKLRWKTVISGTPGIFVFKAVDSTGGTGHLTAQTTAEAQISPSVYLSTSHVADISPIQIGEVTSTFTPSLHTDSIRGTNDYFIYCGTKRGSGELAVTVYKDSQIMGETSVFLDIRDVKELYERWTIGDDNGGTPTTNAVLVADGLPSGVSATQFTDSSSSPRPYMLLVHGWNMAPWEKDSFAETAFKRLYWQGNTNRFGTLRWPTTYDFNPPRDALIDPRNYDNGEFSAWRSGVGLRHHLAALNTRYPGKVYLVAHSMGNVVAGEALAIQAEKFGTGAIVNTYVASQAAVPVHAYLPNPGSTYELSFDYTPLPTFSQRLVWTGSYPGNWDSKTANVYPSWLATNRTACIARVNFYNPHDFALQIDAWQFNQILKPDQSYAGPAYYYVATSSKKLPKPGSGSSVSVSHLIPSPARNGYPVLSGVRLMPGIFAKSTFGLSYDFLDFEFDLTAMYEVMSYASEARTIPVGACQSTALMERQLDIRDVWPTDTEFDDRNGSFGRHKWHSGQFRSSNVRQRGYWQALLGQTGFRLTEIN